MRVLKKTGWGIFGLLCLYMLVLPFTLIRYRLTVEVDTPEGLKTGFSVNRAAFEAQPAFLGVNAKLIKSVRGEAVTIDLGPRGTMYALLTGRSQTTGAPDNGQSQAEMLLKVLALDIWRRQGPYNSVWQLKFLSGSADVPADLLPSLVRFRDEKDPKTVEAVDPGNLAASFGDGVSLKRVTIETVSSGVFPFNLFGITGEPLTTGIEKRLGWLDDPAVIKNPGWKNLPSLAQQAVMGLRKPINRN